MLTGHSKGGAEALVLGAMLAVAGLAPARITTFGAPRVGDAAFGRLLAGIAGADYRYGGDPVPFVPPQLEHPRGLQAVGPVRTFARVGDHAIGNYVEALGGGAP